MVYVDGTHVDVLLVTAGPDAFDLEIELRKGTSGDLMVQITQKVELLLETNKCSVGLLPEIIKQYSILIKRINIP